MCQLMITKHDDIFADVSLNDVGVSGWKLSAVIARRSLNGGMADTEGLVETEGNFRLLCLLHVLNFFHVSRQLAFSPLTSS